MPSIESFPTSDVPIGKTKAFLRARHMAELDARRTEVLGRPASNIQRKVHSLMT
ncbi:hypothetical protein Hanom_Chr13g01219801 [Helianthus anomalus]